MALLGGEQYANVKVQAIVCTTAITICKKVGLIRNLAPFDPDKAKKCTRPAICR